MPGFELRHIRKVERKDGVQAPITMEEFMATEDLVRELIQQELGRIEKERGTARFNNGKFKEATALFDELIASETLDEFLTLKAYEKLD